MRKEILKKPYVAEPQLNSFPASFSNLQLEAFGIIADFQLKLGPDTKHWSFKLTFKNSRVFANISENYLEFWNPGIHVYIELSVAKQKSFYQKALPLSFNGR